MIFVMGTVKRPPAPSYCFDYSPMILTPIVAVEPFAAYWATIGFVFTLIFLVVELFLKLCPVIYRQSGYLQKLTD
ncbi:hypothetical protein D3C77_638570 [compost metagenome]